MKSCSCIFLDVDLPSFLVKCSINNWLIVNSVYLLSLTYKCSSLNSTSVDLVAILEGPLSVLTNVTGNRSCLLKQKNEFS